MATLKKMLQGLNKTIVSQLEREDDDDPTVLHTWNKTMEEVNLSSFGSGFFLPNVLAWLVVGWWLVVGCIGCLFVGCWLVVG